ncbi:VWA domain-containing protein [Clostridium botulinum]|nr:VWA domain-containing protein [Clostridium botulinum]NFP02377.1 VWA domain-containing protein [Clostridium botulinum]
MREIKLKKILKDIFKIEKNKVVFVRSIIALLIISVISIPLIIVNAAEENLPNEPSFEIQIDKAQPNPSLIGEDIEISGRIIPKSFEMDIKRQKKEIVLVLDTSGSMGDEVEKDCTNYRGWYCTTHNRSDKHYIDSFFKPHNWINDYCEEHRKIGNHKATKLSELKNAANNFIDKMKDVPDLKIGIVAYSNESIINPNEKEGYRYSYNINGRYSEVPNYKSTCSDRCLDLKESETLKKIVYNLEPLGGTNTGEGLRKAEYMLEQGEERAMKTIVFMSDGLPTFYSVLESSDWWGNRYYDYYNLIDDTSPKYAGTGNSDVEGYCKKYAKEIGSIINDNKINVFSLGYGLGNENSDSNKIMKEIHHSMGGANEDFFATDAGAIDKVFSQIADKIIESYTIDNLQMDMNFKSEDGFSLKIGGNTVKLNNIVYKKESEKDGKILYKADEVPFKFIIKGNKIGQYKNVFENSKGRFIWKENEWDEGKTISVPIKTSENFMIEISDNILPNLYAKLISAENIDSKAIDEVIDVEYEINTKAFKYNIATPLRISNAQLNLDLGDNFELVEAGILEKIDNEKNKYKVKLPEIKYELQNEAENNGKWIQKNTIEVKFKIRKSINSGYRDLGFGAKDNNNISYSSFSKKNIFNNIPTPIINYKGSDVRHGIYYGIGTDGKPNINVSTVKPYPKGARINFGGDFKYNGQKNIQLNIDNHENIEVDGAIKIYKIENNGLSLLKSINETVNQKKYNIDLTNLALNNEDKILILYNEFVLNISGTFTNTIKIDDSSVERATIKVEEKDIPELF